MENENTRLLNEDTRILNEYESAVNADTSALNKPTSSSMNKKNTGKGKTIAATAGGFVAGAAVGGAAMAAAQSREETVIPEVNNDENQDLENSAKMDDGTDAQNQPTSVTPNPEEVILANDEGIRYAHVNADNFNDAFAQARAQVGAGGVFEYHGKLYGTYYADEWNEMSAEDRAAYQSRVNGIAPTHHYEQPTHNTNSYDMANNSNPAPEAIPTNVEMIDVEPVDNEIRVLGVETVQNPDGQIMNVALLESNGDQALLIDVDNNGVMDVFLHDDNFDNQIQESEVHDISGAGIALTDLIQAQAEYTAGSSYLANDDMPDYLNNADMTMDV